MFLFPFLFLLVMRVSIRTLLWFKKPHDRIITLLPSQLLRSWEEVACLLVRVMATVGI